MKILICNWKDLRHPAAGGAEVYTHEVARRWSDWGHEVTLFAAAAPGLPATEAVDGVQIVRSGTRLTVYREARGFFQDRRGTFDVVIDEVNTRPFFCHRWAGSTPVVALIHQIAREVWRHETPLPVALAGRYFFEPRWLRQYRAVPALTVSESSRESLLDHGLRRVSVVPEGIDLPRGLPSLVKSRLPTIAFVGRLTGSKRPGDVLAAHALVRQHLPGARLHFVGDGPLRERLVRSAGSGVVFHGRVSERAKFEILSRAHVLAVTSVREGWGLVVDEAAAVGAVPVGYDVPGLRDSVPAARGHLVSPDIDSLAAELLALLPPLAATPHQLGWGGGARPWDEVADVVLGEIMKQMALARVGGIRG